MDEYLSELRNKYGYNDDLLKAIEITINLMIEEYGEDQRVDIFSLFAGAQITALREVNHETLDKLDEKMRSYNPHIIFSKVENPYECDLVASSYNYEPIYSADMQVRDEARHIIAQDMKGRFNEDGYRRVFGTSINMPYFLHEANHAYAMMHPEYKYEGKKIIAKHGMYITCYEYELGPDQKYIMKTTSSQGIILEEAINEKITQDMLVRLLKKTDFKEVKEVLDSIHHVGTSYNAIMITLGSIFEEKLGKTRLMDYRRNNNYEPIANFNQKVSQSDIALEYIGDLSPFEYFGNKIHELFTLNINKYKMKIDDYSYEAAKLMIEALAPISAFEEIEHQTMNIEKFNKRRDKLLGTYPQYQNNGLSN